MRTCKPTVGMHTGVWDLWAWVVPTCSWRWAWLWSSGEKENRVAPGEEVVSVSLRMTWSVGGYILGDILQQRV